MTSLSEVNAILSQLFTIIPRKMEKVEDYLAHTEMDAAEIITREEALLDIMTGKVNQKQDIIYEMTIYPILFWMKII